MDPAKGEEGEKKLSNDSFDDSILSIVNIVLF